MMSDSYKEYIRKINESEDNIVEFKVNTGFRRMSKTNANPKIAFDFICDCLRLDGYSAHVKTTIIKMPWYKRDKTTYSILVEK